MPSLQYHIGEASLFLIFIIKVILNKYTTSLILRGSKMEMHLFVLLFIQLQSALWLACGYNISKPNCLDHCGEVEIPYPFGINAGCYHDASYEIICNNSFQPAKPFLRQLNLEVMDIHWSGKYSLRDPQYQGYDNDQTLVVATPPRNICRSDHGVKATHPLELRSIDLRGSPYRFSSWSNVFVVEGCGGSVVLKNRSGEILTGCSTVCSNGMSRKRRSANCYGVGCCQASLLGSPTGDYVSREDSIDIDFYEIAIDHEALSSDDDNSCNMAAALIASRSLNDFNGRSLSSLEAFPTVLEWYATFIPTNNLPFFHGNVSCTEYGIGKQQCSCSNDNYEGNPYLPYGCQVVSECRKCRHGCEFDYLNRNYYCRKNRLLKLASILGFSIGSGIVLLVLGCYWLYRFLKRRREIKQKAKYFKRNGGLLLQQQMSSSDGVVERTKIFTVTELQKATDNFNENRILGRGGQGTVYKGMLMDGRIVAVKKSKKVDESQLEQFINEVVILSQINHRNVVKLLGCCLETEVPLLVYEFVSNGTLYQHLQDPNEDFHVTWKMRLQIAAESAGALAYLHSSSSVPIYHRDIKSSNILLDDKYRAKVSDFGTSRAITIEQTHVTTCVLGTYGYLDPEYFQSNQFTDKSDVYSFGVVLVELITGKKPLTPDKSGGWISLANEFLYQMEISRLTDILDPRIIDEGEKEEFIAVANLARQCLKLYGKQRPTMKEISVLLDGIRSPHVPMPNLKEPSCVESKHVFMETSGLCSGPVSTTSIFVSDDGESSSSFSIEVLPLVTNSI